MKKRLLALACSVMLVASFSMTALAAPSTQATVKPVVETATDKNGKDISGYIKVEAVAAENKAAVDKVVGDTKELEKVVETVGGEFKDTMNVVAVQEVKITGDASAVTFPVKVVFQVKGVTPSTKITTLHLKADGTWESVSTVAGNGTVTCTFNSLSPVVFVVDGKLSTTSPSTGQFGYVWAIAAIAVGVVGTAMMKKRA